MKFTSMALITQFIKAMKKHDNQFYDNYFTDLSAVPLILKHSYQNLHIVYEIPFLLQLVSNSVHINKAFINSE